MVEYFSKFVSIFAENTKIVLLILINIDKNNEAISTFVSSFVYAACYTFKSNKYTTNKQAPNNDNNINRDDL